MVEIEKPRIECIEKPGDNSYGKCVVEPLERGYGTTLGNSLRRILLSSLPGTAVTSIKIAGVQHEFTIDPRCERGRDRNRPERQGHHRQALQRGHQDGVYRGLRARARSQPATSRPTARWRSSTPTMHIATLGPERQR